MEVKSLKYVTLSTFKDWDSLAYQIIEIKVTGTKKELQHFNSKIQDRFDLGNDEWDSNLKLLTLTFDKKPKKQTLRDFQRFVKEYLKQQETQVIA